MLYINNPVNISTKLNMTGLFAFQKADCHVTLSLLCRPELVEGCAIYK